MGVSQNRMAKNQKAQELPINESPSNEKWDKLGYTMFGGLIVVALVLIGSGLYYSSNGFMEALNASPIEWLSILWMTLLLGLIYFAGRALISLAFFGTVMLTSKFGAWQCGDNISRIAIKYRFLVPNGSGWAAMALVQSLISRGKFSESIEIADAEWERSGNNEKQAMNLGPMCVAVAMAHQVDNNLKQTATWNERAIDALTKMLENAEGGKKGLFAWAAKAQASNWVGQVKMQLSAAYFSNAQVYMQQQDFRRAKGSFKNAADFATQAPDFPQKDDIVKMSKEQLQRLKHA